jgi:hypothetical protein
MPAFPPDTFINDSFCLFSNAVQVLAPDAGISPEPECFVKPVIECSFFEQVHGPVHPPDQVRVPRVEIIRNVVRPEFTMVWYSFKPEKEA